jgi:hypothetical protein
LKTLAPDEIELLLQARPNDRHPLDILGYGYTSDGARRFRTERPDFSPQIIAHIGRILRASGIFPAHLDRNNPGSTAFIYADGSSFRVSSLEEVGVSRDERLSSEPLSEREAILAYIRRVANSDYVHCPET